MKKYNLASHNYRLTKSEVFHLALAHQSWLGEEAKKMTREEKVAAVKDYRCYGMYSWKNWGNILQEAQTQKLHQFLCYVDTDILLPKLQKNKAQVISTIESLAKPKTEYFGQCMRYGWRFVTSVILIDGTVVETKIPLRGDHDLTDRPLFEYFGEDITQYIKEVNVRYLATPYTVVMCMYCDKPSYEGEMTFRRNRLVYR